MIHPASAPQANTRRNRSANRHAFGRWAVLILAGAVAVLILGGFLIWHDGGDASSQTTSNPAGAGSDHSAQGPENFAPLTSRVESAHSSSASSNAAPSQPRIVPAAPGAGAFRLQLTNRLESPPQSEAEWETMMNEYLEASIDDTNIAFHLLGMLPQMPQTVQVEAAAHITHLLSDEDYGVLGPTLTDPATDAEVLDVLIGDLLNRPESVQLPLFLEMARNPQHAQRAEAKEYLELYLQEDYGGDWEAWRQAMDQYLRTNPDP